MCTEGGGDDVPGTPPVVTLCDQQPVVLLAIVSPVGNKPTIFLHTRDQETKIQWKLSIMATAYSSHLSIVVTV